MDIFTSWPSAKSVPADAGTAPSCCGSGQNIIWDGVSFGLVTFGVVMVFLTFRDYGVTWDEDAHNWYGNFVLDYYSSFLTDKSALHWQDLYNYGAIFDTVAAALNRISAIGIYETRHLLNGLVGILGLVGCWKLARAIGGARVGCIAVIFLLLIPNYYGQMFNNPKDIPFAVGVVWATYYLVRIVGVLPRPPLSLLARLGGAIGMTMGVRIGGLLLMCYLGLLLGLDGIWRMIIARRSAPLVESAITSLWRVFIPVVLVAYPVMLLFWPWAQIDPIENPLHALAFFSHQTFPFGTLFAGRLVLASDLPWIYLPTYVALALPELLLVLLISAPITAGIRLLDSHFQIHRARGLSFFIICIGIVFPVTYSIAIKAVLFDGMRQFIFVLPLVAVTSAVVADEALTWLARFPYRRPIYVMLALYGVAHVSIMAMLHPDQYIYYNAFAGGVEGAQRMFKLDYWANSYAEAVQGLDNYLRATYGPDFEEREFTVAVCGPPISADYYFPANFRFTRYPNQADFFIAFTKDDCDRSLPGRPVYQVKRMGTLLSVVLDRRGLRAEQRTASQPLAGTRSGTPQSQ